MLSGENMVSWLIFLIAAILLTLMLWPQFTPEARERRKRRRNYSRVMSRDPRPAVKLSARTPKD